MSADVIVTVLAAIAIVVGCAGIIIPVLPGSIAILISVLVWAIVVGGAPSWIAFAAVAVFTICGMSASWLITGKRLKVRGVSNWSLTAGLVVAIVGFFVVPVIGMPLGFIAGLYLAEWVRLKDARLAWDASWDAIKALGLGIAVEFSFAALAAAAFTGGVWYHFATT